ncbi:hypothetical protein CAPTEDRAFT_215103 [Capitella teleta]|uniref:Uncharacterized protein n=1 Tax=Capitella teleta TaxID=283909 RepID=R7UIQ1_CAPTE|nr:hypothetical protein CAPTEDRAFT_215103 [Capitella teleta]|eukprot:ELU06444.1 hypothetical protein CAPTEDRAFT_215103 [Capitella teleta]
MSRPSQEHSSLLPAGADDHIAMGKDIIDKDKMDKGKPNTDDFDDDDGFAEDECTLDFDDDDEVMGPDGAPSMLVYREYDGEDFAKYLEEDDLFSEDTGMSSLPRSHYSRPKRKMHGKAKKWNDSGSSEDSGNRVRSRLSQVLTLGRSRGQKETAPRPQSIHQFSYTHTKIGVDGPSTASSEDGQSSGRFQKHKSSHSDYGTTSASWWNKHKHVTHADTRETRSEIAAPPSRAADTDHKNNSLWRRFSRTLRRKQNVEYVVDDDLVPNGVKVNADFENSRL